jgi:predicted dehydrogenase
MGSANLRLGIVGCGAVVRQYHLPALTQIPQVRTTVLCDKKRANALRLKRQFGLSAEITDDVANLVGKVEAALVAVPPRFHASVTIELLRQGIDVLCEKPLALTVAEAEEMVRVAREEKRILAVGLMTRFHNNNWLVRDLLTEGRLGEIEEIIAEYGAPLNWEISEASYYKQGNAGHGVFFDTGVHLLDRLIWIFGELRGFEYMDDSYGGCESNAILKGYFEINGNRVPCRLAVSWTHFLNNSIQVLGKEGLAELKWKEPNTVFLKRYLKDQLVECMLRRAGRPPVEKSTDIFCVQLKDFIEAVSLPREPFVSAVSSLPALKVIEKAYSIRKRIAQPWVETPL